MRGADLSVCQRVDKFGLPAIWYETVCDWDSDKTICNFVEHNYSDVNIGARKVSDVFE